MEAFIHWLTIYSIQILYSSTPIQSIIFYDGNPIFALRNLSIHMLVSIFVVNGKACNLMFSQFVVYALLLSNMCVHVCVCVFFSIN
jgi:hypothetical protein